MPDQLSARSTMPARLPLSLRSFILITSIIAFTALSFVGPALVRAQTSDVAIAQLDCDADPEVVSITNNGESAVDLDGWSLQSNPADAEMFDLSEIGELSGGASINVMSGPSATGALVWSEEEIFRDGDADDFARLVNADGETVDEAACAAATATPTAAPTPTPTPGAPPNGGGPPAPGSGPLTALVFAGAGLSTAAIALFAAIATPLGRLPGRLRGRLETTRPETPRHENRGGSLIVVVTLIALMVLLVALAIGARQRR